MTPEQQRVVFGLIDVPGRGPSSTRDDVLRAFSTKNGAALGVALLEEAIATRDSDGLEAALLVCQTFGCGPSHLPLLLQLAPAEWHHSHEDVIWYLGGYRGSEVVAALYRATQWVPDYLEFDEYRALARKAIWALGTQDAVDARPALERLAQSEDGIVRREATAQLER